MAEPNLKIILTAVDNASDVLQGVGSAFERHRKQIGIAMTAVGGAITGVAVLAIKSSQEQAIGIARLDTALQRVGSSYAAERAAIEASISAMQKKTNFSDEQQRAALEQLVTLTGTYQVGLEALPAVLNVATSLNMDLNSAALLVGKALAGNTSILTRYGVTLAEGADQTEIIAALTAQFGGSAEAAANPMVQLKNSTDDLMQVLGDALLPTITSLVGVLSGVIGSLQRWAEAHPGLAKVISIVVVALGGLMLVLGPLLLMLPGLIAGIAAFGVVLNVALGPVGLIALAIAGLIAVGILLWKNWDTIKEWAVKLWEFLQEGFEKFLDYAKVWGPRVVSLMFAPIVLAVRGILELLEKLIEGISRLPLIGGRVAGLLEGIQSLQAQIDKFTFTGMIPGLQRGGIVTRPTLAMVGEAGPEAIIPLRGGTGGGIAVTVPIYLDGRFIATHLGQQAVRAEQVRSS